MLNRLRRLSPKTLKADLSAGLTTALVAVPDGIASAILAGLNPIHGLYALMIGTPIEEIAFRKGGGRAAARRRYDSVEAGRVSSYGHL